MTRPLLGTCKEFAELITEHLDGTLGDDARSRFEAHGTRCLSCRAYLQQSRLTPEALASMPLERSEPTKLADPLSAFARRPWRPP